MTKKTYWATSSRLPKLPRLDKDLTVDVAIVGGGITGVTAAYLLKKAGCSVAPAGTGSLWRRRYGSYDGSPYFRNGSSP